WRKTDYTMAYENGSVVMKGDQRKAAEKMADLFPDYRNIMLEMSAQMIEYSRALGSLSSDENSIFGKTGFDRIRAFAATGMAYIKHKEILKEMLHTPFPEFVDRYMPPCVERDRIANSAYRNMPTLFGTGFWYTWFEDYWYYIRGQQGLMDDIAKLFMDNGGSILYNQTVDQILTEKNNVRGVKTTDGNYYMADNVVYAGALKKLYTDMLDPAYLDPEMIAEIRDAGVSQPMAAVYLGVDMTNEELSKYLQTHHTLFFPNEPPPDFDNIKNENMHYGAFTEITWTSMRYPHLAPEKMNSLVLQSLTTYNWMDKWGTGGDDFSRPDRYKYLKKTAADHMIDNASRYIPGLKDRIVYQDSGTPMSTIRFTLNTEGASCGWDFELEKSYLKDKKVSITTPYKGLFTIGHFAFWPGGVTMAALSGVIAAMLIKHDLSFNILRKVKNMFRK
ncbi:MAG: FAD-dependent oxidoreductase, partial [Spirochaetes bacterium]|nr:FAD-dependent oxidoreductase [Spirochaetota bacterium]